MDKIVNDYKIKQERVIHAIKEDLLIDQKYNIENKPYYEKLFYNHYDNIYLYVNEYGYLIPFLGKKNNQTSSTCPSISKQEGYDIYAYTKEGAVMKGGPICSIYGNNVQDNKTKEYAWVDIMGYKHIYVNNEWKERDVSCKSNPIVLTHKQYSVIPTSTLDMTKDNFCLKRDINPSLIYEYKMNNEQFIEYLTRIKTKNSEDRKNISNIIEILKKQNLSIVQQMNEDSGIDAMLNDSRVKVSMSEYQTLSWVFVGVLGIGLIVHFGKK